MATKASDIDEHHAQAALAFAVDKARAAGVSIAVSILDSGRNLVAFLRMSGTPLGAIEVSQGKAYTACSVQMRTHDLAPHVQPGAPFYGFETSHRHPLVVFGGGVPVTRNGIVVGAVGVSGGSIDEDVSLAEAVTAFLEQSLVRSPG
jgi:uncharacterized protein GlcG (DUF336 family)